jgi:hypothetical protein
MFKYPDNLSRPKLWFPAGGGGAWVNYLIWCNYYQRTLPETPVSFAFEIVSSTFPNYHMSMDCSDPHNSTITGDILLGSNSAWYNFYLYNHIKNYPVDKTYYYNNLYNRAVDRLNLWKKNIQFNLEWTLIWTNPIKFLKDLNSLKNINLNYGIYSEIAFDQYRKSCLLPDIKNNEFRSSDGFKYWHKAVFDTQTDITFSDQQRIDQAEFILEELYWPGYKK